MAITAIGNQKGGVGKTTVTLSLASELARLGLRVGVIDMDMQANATMTLGTQGEYQIDDVLVGTDRVKLLDAFVDTEWEGIKAIQGSQNIIGLEQERDAALAAYRLRDAFEEIGDLSAHFDHVLIDMPPASGLISATAMIASEQVLAVTKPEPYGTAGLDEFLDRIDEIKRRLNPGLRLFGVLINMYARRSNEHRFRINELREQLESPEMLLEPFIPNRLAAAEMPSERKPLHALTKDGARVLSSLFETHARRLAGMEIADA